MTFNEFATQPHIVLALLALMCSLLLAIAGLLWKISKAVVPVVLMWKVDYEKQKEHCSGEFKITRIRLDEHDEQITSLGNRIGVVEITLKDKYAHQEEKPDRAS